MLSLAAVLLLLHALDESQVKVTERHRVLTEAPPTTDQLGTIDRGSLSRLEAEDLARLEARFVARATRVGIETQAKPTAAMEDLRRLGGPAPPSYSDAVAGIAISKRRVGETTTWVFTTNKISTFEQGTDCCPRCYGDCARCMARNCRTVTTGSQLVVTFTTEGRVLLREDAVFQTIEEPDPPGTRRLGFRVEGRATEPLLKVLNRHRRRLSQCISPEWQQPLAFQFTWDPNGPEPLGRLTESTPNEAETEAGHCVLTILRSVKVPRPAKETRVVFHFDPDAKK